MHRFYLTSFTGAEGQNLLIEDDRIVHQVTKVLRMKKGHYFHVFQENTEWLVKIQDFLKKKIMVECVSEVHNEAEPTLKVALYQGIPKKPGVFELIVQKATELGVTEIYPFITERTQNRRLSKIARLHLIALEATEQCGRLTIPQIHHPVLYEEVMSQLTNGFIAYEYEAEHFLSDYQKEIQKAKALQIIIGPEGGLSETEIDLAKASGVKPFSLGKRILRTETAAIAALSQLLCKS